jgi:hypothetical protein
MPEFQCFSNPSPPPFRVVAMRVVTASHAKVPYFSTLELFIDPRGVAPDLLVIH